MSKGIEIRLADVIVEELEVGHAQVTPDAKFAELGADSLDMQSLALTIEDEFKIEITDDVLEAWVTVWDAVRDIRKVVE